MKYASILLAVSCLLSVVHAQWLETTIQLPDSAEPYALCYNPSNNKVYSANQLTNSVSVIDGATNAVLAHVAVDSFPFALCYDSKDNLIYCANRRSGTLTAIDGATDIVRATVGVGSEPVALCYDPDDNLVFCANRGSDNVSVVDGATCQVIATTGTAAAPSALCYAPAWHRVYCVAFDADTVNVIDAPTGQLVAAVPVGVSPGALCYDPQNGHVICAHNSSSTAVIIDCATNGVVATLDVGSVSADLCFNALSGRVYCSGGALTVIDGDTVVATVSTGAVDVLCCDPENNKVYCTSFLSGKVVVVDCAADSVVKTLTVGLGPRGLAWNPAQNRVYVANSYDWTISVLRDSGGGVEEMANGAWRMAQSRPTVLSRVSGVGRLASSVVFDAMGRRVQNPKPGVYFLREEPQAPSLKPQAVTKVVILE